MKRNGSRQDLASASTDRLKSDPEDSSPNARIPYFRLVEEDARGARPRRARPVGRQRKREPRESIDRAVSEAVQQWKANVPAPGAPKGKSAGKISPKGPPAPGAAAKPAAAPASPESILVSMPRRTSLLSESGEAGQASPPMMHLPTFHVSRIRVLWRMLSWVYVFFLFGLGILADRLLRRDTVARRAVRLRAAFERLGGTFIKVGQQLAMRMDLLPMEYCNELAKMLDKVAPFDTKTAIAIIERTTQKPLHETFSAFDPKPIGSASLACVFQAELKNGEKVAVKVRRPRIGEKFSADITAFGWLIRLLEWSTLVRPGQFSNLESELRNVFLEELNFRREARYTELFGIIIEENEHEFLGAPRVHFNLSGDEVLVTEFVDGTPLSEILAATDRKDQAALARLREMNIEPQQVAKHLLRATMLGIYENIIFHADPHPANVIVQEDSKLILIDFGSCGSYTNRERRVMRQMQYFQLNNDVAGMVQAGIDLLEPLPPIDLESFAKKMELVYWQVMYALKSKHSEWWERTQMAMWIYMLELVREYHMSLNLNMLRVVRATLLVDSAAGRLDPAYDMFKEYDEFSKELGRLARERVQETNERLLEGAEDRNYVMLEQGIDAINKLVYQWQRKLDNPGSRYTKMVNKSSYAGSVLIRSLVSGAFFTGLFTAAVAGVHFMKGHPVSSLESLKLVVTNGGYLAFMALGGLLGIRRVLYRFDDLDVADHR